MLMYLQRETSMWVWSSRWVYRAMLASVCLICGGAGELPFEQVGVRVVQIQFQVLVKRPNLRLHILLCIRGFQADRGTRV